MSRLSKERIDELRRLEHAGYVGGTRTKIADVIDTIDALESELVLNQAAILREAASAVSGVLGDRAIDQAHRVIFAIPTDQPALDRHDAELQRNGCKCICHEEPKHVQLQVVLDGLKWSNNKIVELKAQTAALLEKAAKHDPMCGYKYEGGGVCPRCGWVPPPPIHTSAAAALEERERKARADATEQCAIEAGERSPEGCSSHTMLGDMWDRRIVELRAEQGAKQP